MAEKLQGVIKDISDIPIKKWRWFEHLLDTKPLIALIVALIIALIWTVTSWHRDNVAHEKKEVYMGQLIVQANARADSAYKFNSERVDRALDRQEKINDQLMDKLNTSSK